ncbi:MAG: hypothetical protein R6U52_06940 [Kosmotogaceae bacterium]
MRKLLLLIVVLFSFSLIFSTTLYLGTGYNGISKITFDGNKWTKTQHFCPPISTSGVETTSYIYTYLRDHGFCVIDKEHMSVIAQIDTFHAEDIAIDINKLKIYVADGVGLGVYFIERPSRIWFRGKINLKGWISQIELIDNYIVVASQLNGIYLLRECSDYFIPLDFIGPDYLDPLKEPLMINSLEVFVRTIYIATNDSLRLIRISNNKFHNELQISDEVCLDVAVNGTYIAAAEPMKNRVSLFLTSNRTKSKEIFFPNQPAAVELLKDENTGRLFLATIVRGTGLVIDDLSSGDRWTIGGSYMGFIRKLSVQ